MPRLRDEQRAAILADVRAGGSVRAIARDRGCNPSTVSRIATRNGIDCNVAQTKKAAAARTDWALAQRLDFLNRLFTRAESLLPDCRTPRQLQTLVTATAILIDKRRLEDGEATSRAEVSSPAEEARERIARRIDELAARRREKAAVG